ncbi:MAG: hypothetical protein JO255_21555 [Alphaproteobacteria bacterium]|nr:hypothetical protein [Alphaproteobacteria bacterium]
MVSQPSASARDGDRRECIGPVDPDSLNGAWFRAIACLRDTGEGVDADLSRRIAHELGDDQDDARNAALRVGALWRLLASRPRLRRIAVHRREEGGMIREETLVVAAELALAVPHDAPGLPEFDPGEFIAALRRLETARSGH